MENLTPIVEETVLKVKGVTKPTTIYMATDSHLLLCDETDDEQVRDYFVFAKQWFIDNGTRKDKAEAHDIFEKQLDLICEEKPDVTVFTGDMVCAPTTRGISYLASACKRVGSYMYVPGNHDWIKQKDLSEHGELTAANRVAAIDRFKDIISAEEFDFQVKELNGVLLIGMNTTDYQATAKQVEQLKAQLERNMPCILFLHIPVYTKALGKAASESWGAPLTTGIPDELITDKMPTDMAKILKADENSKAFMELISRKATLLKAIFAGHLHFSHESELENGVKQYVVNMGYNGAIRKIEIVNE